MTSSLRSPPPLVLFDHVPSDAEAAVFFPERSFNRDLLRRMNGDRETWELTGIPLWGVAIALCIPAAGVAFGRWSGKIVGDDFSFVVAMGVMIVVFAFAFFHWLNQSIRALNPVLVFDRSLGELRVQGRTEVLAVRDVVELIEWTLTPENERALRLNTDGETIRQTSALLRRADGFELVPLFHDNGNVYHLEVVGRLPRIRHRSAAKEIAASLGVPLRKIGVVDVARDVRPPDRFSKRPEEITKRFTKRKGSK